VWVVSSNYPDECPSASQGGDSEARLPVQAEGQRYTVTDGESGDDMAVRLGDTWT
jgi:hypothetical protein